MSASNMKSSVVARPYFWFFFVFFKSMHIFCYFLKCKKKSQHSHEREILHTGQLSSLFLLLLQSFVHYIWPFEKRLRRGRAYSRVQELIFFSFFLSMCHWYLKIINFSFSFTSWIFYKHLWWKGGLGGGGHDCSDSPAAKGPWAACGRKLMAAGAEVDIKAMSAAPVIGSPV